MFDTIKYIPPLVDPHLYVRRASNSIRYTVMLKRIRPCWWAHIYNENSIRIETHRWKPEAVIETSIRVAAHAILTVSISLPPPRAHTLYNYYERLLTSIQISCLPKKLFNILLFLLEKKKEGRKKIPRGLRVSEFYRQPRII